MEAVMRQITFLAVMLFAVATAMAQTPVADTLAAADAAFRGGKNAEALRLYDAVLAAEPDNVPALVQSGQLLSWQKEYDAAIDRYDRALQLDPGNAKARMERAKVLSWSRQWDKAAAAYREILANEPQNADAKIGLARVLSWSKHYDEASVAYRRILEEDPANNDAQIGLARNLSWSGRQEAARAEYMKILESKPGDVDATLGVAQTYAWSGQRESARDWYQRVLNVEPDRREAILGMAYLDLASGERGEAGRRTSQLESRFPQDEEVRELRGAVNRATAPTFRAGYDSIEDTEDNQVDIFGAEVGFALPKRSDLSIGYSHHDLTNRDEVDATIDGFFATFVARPTLSQRLGLRIGTETISPTVGDENSETTGRASYAFGVGTKFETTLMAERRPFRYTTRSVDAGIVIDAYTLSFGIQPTSAFRIGLSGNSWSLSDDNERTGADANMTYRWKIGGARLGTGYVFHFFDYDLNLDNGYFDPQDFTSHGAQLSLYNEIRSFYFDATVEGGIQSFELAGIETSDDQYFTGTLLLGFRITPGLAFELIGVHSDSALENPAGFESDQYSARLRWTAGR